MQKQLIILHKFAQKHQNSGTLEKLLHHFLKDLNKDLNEAKQKAKISKTLFKTDLNKENIQVVAILVDIVAFNSRIYPVAMAILGILLDKIKSRKFSKKILSKLNKICNNAYMEIWLQRAILKLNHISKDFQFNEKICKKIQDDKFDNEDLWDMEWLECKKLKDIVKKYPIINKDEISKIEKYTQSKEVNTFEKYKI